MIKIKKILAIKIINNNFISIKVITYLNSGSIGVAIIPVESSSIYEYIYLKNINLLNFFNKKANEYINFINNNISNILINKNPSIQYEIDNIMILTFKNYNKVNNLIIKKSILVTSISIARSYSNYRKIKLYKLISEISKNNNLYNKKPNIILNIFNKNYKDILCNYLDIEDFMIQINISNFSLNKIFYINTLYKNFIKNIKYIYIKYKNKNKRINSYIILNEINSLINKYKFYIDKNMSININLSMSNLYDIKNNLYFSKEKNKILNFYEIINYIKNILNIYPIYYIENSSYKYDWKLSYIQTKIFNNTIQLVGDLIFNNDYFLIKQGINNNICNSILIKYYNMYSISEIINLIILIKKKYYKIIISNIYRFINDSFFIELALGVSSDQVKIGYIYDFNIYKNLLINKL